MSRVTKLLICLVLAVVAIGFLVAVQYQIAAPANQGYGDAAPVTQFGWAQNIAAILSALGFTGATFWQAALAWAQRKVLPSPGADTPVLPVVPAEAETEIRTIIDVAKLATTIALIKSAKDPAAREKYTQAARLEFDVIRDELFPAPLPAATSGGKSK